MIRQLHLALKDPYHSPKCATNKLVRYGCVILSGEGQNRSAKRKFYAGGYLRGSVGSGESAIGPPVWPTLCRPQMNSDTDWSVQRLVSFELFLHSRLLVFPHSYHCCEEYPTLKVVTRYRSQSGDPRGPVDLLGFKSWEIPRTKVFVQILVCTKLPRLRVWC